MAAAAALGSSQLGSISASPSFRLQAVEKLSVLNLQASKRHRRLTLRVLAQQARKDATRQPALPAALLLALTTLASNASPAQALSTEDITSAILKIQDVTEKLTGAVGSAYGSSKALFDQFLTTVKPAVDVAVPYVQKATDAAVQVAVPIASDVATQAERALQSAGVDTKPVVDAAKTAVVVTGEAAEQTAKVIEGVKPIASDTFVLLQGLDPLLLFGGAGAFVVLYFLAPSLLSSVAYAARGYKGDLSAAQALDLLSKAKYVLIDVRTEKEKSKSGLPSLPRNVKNKFLSIPLEELPGKLKSQLRNSRKVEAEIVSLKISFLKRIGRGSNLIIIDSFGDIAKIVAKSLSALGFKNTWVVLDGFDGGKGWVQSRLGTDSYNSSIAEILSPSRIIPAGTRKLFKTTSSEVVDVAPRANRLLPGGFE